MQVLPYVIAMLMLIGAITYTRLASFQESALLRLAYENYMREVERAPLEHAVYEIYDNKKVHKSGDPKNNENKNLNTKLHIKGFVNSSERENGEFGSIVEIFIRLLHGAYSQHTFYQDWLEVMASENLREDEAIRQMLTEIYKSADLMAAEGITESKRLAKIEFSRPETRNFFCKLLNGKAGEGGYHPLSHYVDPKISETMVSVYLADRTMLIAIFQDAYLVDEIMAKRNQLYRELTSKRINKEGGRIELQSVIGNRAFTSDDNKLLNYTISSTRPPK
jgi:hypothetical protein